MNEGQEKKWRERRHKEYCDWLEMQDDIYESDIDRFDVWVAAFKASRESHMIDKEAMLILYHLLKTKLGEFIDVEKFLDENSEETPEGFKYHAELVDQLKDRDQEIERLKEELKRERHLSKMAVEKIAEMDRYLGISQATTICNSSLFHKSLFGIIELSNETQKQRKIEL